MAKTIQQTVRFPVSPERLFETYMDSRKHADAIKSTASISRRVGGSFRAFDGMLRGRNLAITPGRMIVQVWRGADWKKTEPDSILILTFERVAGGACLHLVHANIPDRHHAGIRHGWSKYYWRPWQTHFRRRGRPR